MGGLLGHCSGRSSRATVFCRSTALSVALISCHWSLRERSGDGGSSHAIINASGSCACQVNVSGRLVVSRAAFCGCGRALLIGGLKTIWG